MHYNTIHYNALQYNTIQYNTMQCNAMQCNAILGYKTACTIATSIVHSKLDYCNSLLDSINSSQMKRLQIVQNALARAVSKTPIHHHHITPVLKSLGWLSPSTHPLQNSILLHVYFRPTYNTFQTSQPSYIRQISLLAIIGVTSRSRPSGRGELNFWTKFSSWLPIFAPF